MLPKTLDLDIKVASCSLIAGSEWAAPYYLAQVEVNGASHHLSIFPVKELKRGQEAGKGHDGWYDGMQEIDDRAGGYETIEIAGKPYVCLMTPFVR